MTGTLVGLTVPNSAFSATGSPSGGACFVHGSTQQQADALCCDILGRGIFSGGHFYPPVTKKFFFAGPSMWDATANDMVRYRSVGTYVIICLYPKTDGVRGDPSPGVWAAANPGGSYTDSTGVGGASPVRTQALADIASMTSMLAAFAAAGWTSTNCEIVLWQEPGNNLTMNQWNVMLRTYGGVVNTSTAADAQPFKLDLNISGGVGANQATWAKAGMGLGTAWGTGPQSLGLPRVDLLSMDYYESTYAAGTLLDKQDSAGDSVQSLADAAGINYCVNECGANPSTITPLPTRHCTIAAATAYMQYIKSWALGRIAAGKAPRTINWWTANCNADGAAQLSSPIGLATGGLAALPAPDFRLALYQQWVDGLTAVTPTFTMRQSSLQFTGTAGVLSMWNSQTIPPSPSAATLNGSLLVAKIELSDCTNTTTVTGPAGWVLAPHEGKAGTANNQARCQIWYLPNCQAGLYGTSGNLATFTCSNSAAVIKGEMNEWTTPAATLQALDASGGAGAVANVTSLPITATAANVFTGDMGEAMFGARIISGTTGQGWTAPSGWSGSGAISNVADTFQSINEASLAAGTTAVTGLFVPGTWTMSNWAGTVATFTATAAITLADTAAATLSPGTVGTAYSDAITAIGGAGPYTYALTSGTLPTSVSLNTATGALTGTPTVAGTYNFSTTVTDCSQQTVTKAHKAVIAAGVSTLAIGTTALPGGTVGTAYPADALQASGGTPPYTWTVT